MEYNRNLFVRLFMCVKARACCCRHRE